MADRARTKLTRREYLVILRVLHLLAELEIVEQVYDADGKVKWRRRAALPAGTAASADSKTPTAG